MLRRVVNLTALFSCRRGGFKNASDLLVSNVWLASGITPGAFFERRIEMDESVRQSLGAMWFALCEAAGGDDVLRDANAILVDAVSAGAVDEPSACAALIGLVRNSGLEALN
jgi:hypothetical protein